MNYKIISRFIKDISFEIPNVQTFTMLEKEIQKYNLKFDINSRPFKNNIIEVNTILRLAPPEDVKYKILTEINYAALITLDGKPENKKDLEEIILVKVPTEVYPTLYETFIYLFAQTGVKNLKIEKEINFKQLYEQNKKS